jgi:hypothetical protein
MEFYWNIKYTVLAEDTLEPLQAASEKFRRDKSSDNDSDEECHNKLCKNEHPVPVARAKIGFNKEKPINIFNLRLTSTTAEAPDRNRNRNEEQAPYIQKVKEFLANCQTQSEDGDEDSFVDCL